MDDTFVTQKDVNKKDFLQHINNVDPAIQFTVENNKEEGVIPFLDTIVKPEANGNLSITVYRKPTHMGTTQVPTVGQSTPPLSKIWCYQHPHP